MIWRINITFPGPRLHRPGLGTVGHQDSLLNGIGGPLLRGRCASTYDGGQTVALTPIVPAWIVPWQTLYEQAIYSSAKRSTLTSDLVNEVSCEARSEPNDHNAPVDQVQYQ
jgi:hypothetical protein